jgi:hypothetical protein
MASPSHPQPLLSRLHDRYDPASKSHRFIQRSNGFRVEHPLRALVDVRATPSAFVVASARAEKRVDFLFPATALCRMVAALLLDEGPYRPSMAQLMRESWAIAAPVHRLREDLMSRVAPAHLELQRTMSRMIGRVPDLVRHESLYRDPYVVRDVLRYRAAALALARLASEHEDRRAAVGASAEGDREIETATRAMRNWRGLFSPDGVPYRSLNRTLMNLAGEVPSELLHHLARVRLERPITNATELTTLLLFLSRHAEDHQVPADRLSLFQRATRAEIVDGLARVGMDARRELSARRLDDIAFFLGYLADYPGTAGSLRSLVGRAVRWHVELRLREAERAFDLPAGVGMDSPTASPPIPLPRYKNIRFLATVGEVIAEGKRMNHCIASYAMNAVRGECFLFHVDHGGEMASFEIDRRGEVRQAVGPYNSNNDAVAWGFDRLRHWGLGFHVPRRKRKRRPSPGQMTFAFVEPGAAPRLD